MEVDFKFSNGQKVKDLVTGMKGIIDCAALWLNGCKRYSVQPPMKKGETEKPESWWIDEQQLELIDEGLNKKIKPRNTGGPSFRSDSAR